MSYIKNFEDPELLKEIGLTDIESLFSDIPEDARISGLDLPPGMEEWELTRTLDDIIAMNKKMLSFLGGGVYHHHIPAAVGAILSRGELFTSYTPYQPEVSQGMLQSIFEYQSQICELTGMEVSNASMYDASTALGEAALMSSRINRKTEFIIPAAIAPEKKSVLDNYIKGAGMTFKEIPFQQENGQVSLDNLQELMNDNTTGVYIESPNYFGVLEERLPELKEMLPKKTLLTVGINPIAQGILEAPGNFDADIVIGEGQPLGIPANLGGPLIGIMTSRKKHARKMPGRIIGLTRDSQGDRAFAMTLMTREQHIRRERATSNICSNQSLCAVAAGVYMAMVGKTGLRKLALINLRNAHSLAKRLDELPGITAPYFTSPFFNEFTVKIDPEKAGLGSGHAGIGQAGVEGLRNTLVEQGIEPGIPLKTKFDGMDNILLTCSTEVHTQGDHDRLINAIRSAIQ